MTQAQYQTLAGLRALRNQRRELWVVVVHSRIFLSRSQKIVSVYTLAIDAETGWVTDTVRPGDLLAHQNRFTAMPASPSSRIPALFRSRTGMTVRVLSPTHGLINVANHEVTITVRITGMKLDPQRVGNIPVRGHGHIQIYLDRIPPAAYAKPDLKDLIASIATSTLSFVPSPTWVQFHPGRHRLILALAQNNDVLYPAPPTSIAATIGRASPGSNPGTNAEGR